MVISKNKYSLILASKSPRRKELLGHLGIPFTIKSEEIDEVSTLETPSDFAVDIAKQKGEAVFEVLSEQEPEMGRSYFPIIVSSDTIVCLGNKIFGKPDNVEMARVTLLELSGKEHVVITAIHLIMFSKTLSKVIRKSFFEETKVTFSRIDKSILDNYLLSGDSLDKAGAYGIQGQGLSFISSIEGSYSNVVGFPLTTFIQKLKKLIGCDNDRGEWREYF